VLTREVTTSETCTKDEDLVQEDEKELQGSNHQADLIEAKW
jgi:hypothetical protein